MEEDDHAIVTSYRDYKGAQDVKKEVKVNSRLITKMALMILLMMMKVCSTENVSEDRKKYVKGLEER